MLVSESGEEGGRRKKERKRERIKTIKLLKI